MGILASLLQPSVTPYMTLDPLPPNPTNTEEFYTWCEAIERKVLFDPDIIDRRRQELTAKFKRPALMTDIKWSLLMDKTIVDMKKGDILAYGRDKALGGRLLIGQRLYNDAIAHFFQYLYIMTTNNTSNAQGYLSGDEMNIMNMIRAYADLDIETIYRQCIKSDLLKRYIYRTNNGANLRFEWRVGIYTANINF